MCEVPGSHTKTSRSDGNWKTWCGCCKFGSGVQTGREREREKKNAVTKVGRNPMSSRGRQMCLFCLSYFQECTKQPKRTHLRITAGKPRAQVRPRPSPGSTWVHCTRALKQRPPPVGSLSCQLPPSLPISVYTRTIKSPTWLRLGKNILLVAPSVYSTNDKTFSAMGRAGLLNRALVGPSSHLMVPQPSTTG